MKQFFFILATTLFAINIFGQTSSIYNTKDEYYSKTHFNSIDTVDRWTFNIDTSYRGFQNDTIRPIGVITFLRKVKLYDRKYFESNKALWYPYLSFEIFNQKDSLFCFTESRYVRNISSCIPPEVGGDRLIVGDFILLNRQVCLHIRKWDDNIDYARPVINKILSEADKSKIHSFSDFNLVLPIKGKLL